MYLDFPRWPCYGKNNAESVWRQTKAECDVCLLRCSPARVALSDSCATLLYHIVPPAWLWNVLSRNMRAATLTATCFLVSTQWILLVVGLEDTTPAHCTAVTAFRGLTTRLKLQTQPQQWRVSPASHSHKWLPVILESSQTSDLFLKWFAAEAQEVKFQHWCHYVGSDVRNFYRSSDIKLNNSKVWNLNNLKACTLKDTLLHFSTFLGGKNLKKFCINHINSVSLEFVPMGCQPHLNEHIQVIHVHEKSH